MPTVPGFVSEMVVSWKSDAVKMPLRTLSMVASYARKNSSKVIESTFLMFGTISVRVPSFLV